MNLKLKISIIFLVPIFFEYQNAFSQPKEDSLKINIYVKNIKGVQLNDFILYTKIVTESDRTKIPVNPTFGCDYDPLSFYKITLEKKINHNYIPIMSHALYNNKTYFEDQQILKKGLIYSDSTYLGSKYSDIGKGKYRVRILLLFSKINKSLRDKKTDWCYFTLSEKIRPFIFQSIK